MSCHFSMAPRGFHLSRYRRFGLLITGSVTNIRGLFHASLAVFFNPVGKDSI